MTQIKLTKNQLNKIMQDDVNERNLIKSTLQKVQELLNLRESEIASENFFHDDIKAIEGMLSNLRNLIHEIATAAVNKENVFKMAFIDESIIKRVTDYNMKLLSLAKELHEQAKLKENASIMSKNVQFLSETFAERQNLFLTGKLI